MLNSLLGILLLGGHRSCGRREMAQEWGYSPLQLGVQFVRQTKEQHDRQQTRNIFLYLGKLYLQWKKNWSTSVASFPCLCQFPVACSMVNQGPHQVSLRFQYLHTFGFAQLLVRCIPHSLLSGCMRLHLFKHVRTILCTLQLLVKQYLQKYVCWILRFCMLQNLLLCIVLKQKVSAWESHSDQIASSPGPTQILSHSRGEKSAWVGPRDEASDQTSTLSMIYKI